jgi:mono/diheme cytochrome c family protein
MPTTGMWGRLAHIGAASVAVAGIALAWRNTVAQAQRDEVSRGKYLVDVVAACGQCHTPRLNAQEDPARYLAGHPASETAPRFAMEWVNQGVLISVNPTYTAFAGPWGTSFATNLTPDPDTGLGKWTQEQFTLAMRAGKHEGRPNGRDLLPPMPWRHYQALSDEDLRAVWAYLRSIPKVRNRVPQALNRFGRPY